jgi:hypothetical protein
VGVSPGNPAAITDGSALSSVTFGGLRSTVIFFVESITRLSSRRTTRMR